MTIMETRKKSDGDVVVFMALVFLCVFLNLGSMSCNGYYWTLIECEAKKLPNDGELAEFSLLSKRKQNNKNR